MWKKAEKYDHAEKNFREINSVETPQCGNYGNSLSRICGKNFVKLTVLLNNLLKSWFDEIFFCWERISRFSTVWFRNFENLLSRFLDKNFVKTTHLLNKLIMSWFDGKKYVFNWEKKSVKLLCKWIDLLKMFFREINLQHNFSMKVISQKFCLQ